jgi:hypothetical protein
MDSLADPARGLEHAIRNLSPGLTRRYRTVDTLRQHHGLRERRLALPSQLAVLCRSDLDV